MPRRRRIALCLEYDGRGFTGWQTQPDRRGVQDALERALAKIADEPVASVCAGRTDSCVHATAQIVHFDTGAERPPSAWVRGVNSHLPRTVAVLWAQEVGADFHARFAANARHYRYLLLNRPVRPGVLAGRVGWYHRSLDPGRMRRAAQCLLGSHDFSAFRAASCQAASPVRELRRIAIEMRNDMLSFDFEANAFLHHMVRNLVGALVRVGSGAWPVERLADVLAGGERSRAAPTFAADGLYLCGVEYPPKWPLPGDGRIICRPDTHLG